MTVLVGMVVAGIAFAQDKSASARPGMPDVAAQRDAMQKLAAFVGKWQGTGTMQMGQQSHSYNQTEDCAWGLDGLILRVDGRGVDPDAPADAPPVHHAFGVVSYNDRAQKYEFRAYTNRGFASTFDFVMLGDGKFEWGMKMPGNQTRYQIELTNDTWRETGERSGDDGKTWTKFLEMNLKKVKE